MIEILKVQQNQVFQVVKKSRRSDKVRILGFYSLYTTCAQHSA